MENAKLKNGNIFQWTYSEFSAREEPEPYDSFMMGSPCELSTPDKSATFLLLFAGLDDQTLEATHYGIEAPRSCPMRVAFENGAISWEDFWTRLGYVYQFLVPFIPGIISCKRIPVTHMNQMARDAFAINGNKSPWDLKHKNLMLSWELIPPVLAEDHANAEREYKDFMRRHGYRFRNFVA